MTRVLVTGGTGFLGAHVVERLRAAQHRVTTHGLTPGGDDDSIAGDLADPATAERVLAEWRWDAVVNLAGPVTGGTENLATGIDVVAAHVRIALHLRRYARDARIIHASSMTVYGLPDRVEVREDAPRRPQHLYGLAKMLAEDVLLADPALDVWVLRLPGLFSEQRTSGALFHFCRAARAGEPVRVSTPAPTAWNVLHVDDAAEVVVRSVESRERAPGALNISYGEPIDLLSVAQRIADLGGRGSRVEHPADVRHPSMLLVSDRMRALLGWSPPSLGDRLARLYAAYAAA